jgi:hypothetical protein
MQSRGRRMEVFIVGLAALVGGFVLGARLNSSSVVPTLTQVSNTQAIDRANFLQTLRRELTNVMVWRNPQRYLQLYRQLNSEILSLRSWRPEETSKRLAELVSKYPHYSDFDAIGTREYILYADGLSMLDDDDVENRYRDLVMFAALSSLVDPSWKDAATKMLIHTTDEKELAHLTEYVKRIEDTKLRLRMERAIDDNAMARTEDARNLNNDFYSIIDLPHLVENRYGVHLKRTNEFGIYSFFVFDDGRISRNFYTSNPNFTEERLLNSLHSVLTEVTFER